MHACSAHPKATQINCVSWPGDLVKVDDKVSSGGLVGEVHGTWIGGLVAFDGFF